MALAVGHKDGDTIVIDALREVRPPFSPEFAIAQFVSKLKLKHRGGDHFDSPGGSRVHTLPRDQKKFNGTNHKRH